ncbi:DNA mismatch repair protein MLH3 [Rhodotorula toruloides]|uniref:DNA mismatch repair protein n=1 Tax=Rhodotorula toruloides TaxID=5286 RepID=A0A2T0A3U2_RHOTO|nr:DNA mismatch repair protein MLH3 [Rhodotorula toruloides]PRQ72687.1 DNA mismatch repair protein [Rhodotorula toruloides]
MAGPLLQEHPPPQEPPQLALLPPRTSSLIRSSTIVPTLPSILSELVQNSIDARATAIHCAVDLDTWTVRVEDNGTGITQQDLALLRTAARHLTSKLNVTTNGTADEALAGVATYGFRGEALASLQDVGTLEIRTKTADDDEAHQLVLRGGECLAYGESRTERSTGTTVWVRDIFYKLPVRRRALSKSSAQSTLLASLRSTLSTLSLIHPSTSFSLTDTTSSSATSSGESKTLLSVGRSGEGLLGRWRQLWGRAGVEKVWEFNEAEQRGHAEEGGGEKMRARGFFSLSAAHTKAGQFIYVNSRPLAAAQSPLHKLLNTLFASSSFSRHSSSHLSVPSSSVSSPLRARASPQKKSIERFPVFVVLLEVPGRVVDVSFEPDKRVVEFEDPARIESFLTAITKRFLIENGFLHPAAPAKPPAPPATSPTKGKKRARTTGTEDGASVAAGPSTKSRKRVALTDETPAATTPPTRTRSAPSAIPPFAHPSAATISIPSAEANEPLPMTGDDDASYKWTDPVTKQAWLIDGRTGNSKRCDECWPDGAVGGEGRKQDAGKKGMVDRRWLKQVQEREDQTEEAEDVPNWLKSTLETWDNPVFPAAAPAGRTIPSLPSLQTASSAVQPGQPLATLPATFRTTKPMLSNRLTATTLKQMNDFGRTTVSLDVPTPTADLNPSSTPSLAPLEGGTQSFSRASLAQAEFIAQVDTKYLLVRVPASSEGPGATLVLVDQHAASERVRVERFLDAIVGRVVRGEDVEVRELREEERVGVVVSRAEFEAVEHWRAVFERWGLRFAADATDAANEGAYHQLWLSTLPSLLSDRLSKDARLAQDLIRSYVGHLEEHGGGVAGRAGREGESWTSGMKDVPPVLLELINSKACRGAIMFNDVLTPAQASTLLAQLAETSFPFQCAHGRPSLVPIVNLPAASRSAGQGGGIDWSRFA